MDALLPWFVQFGWNLFFKVTIKKTFIVVSFLFHLDFQLNEWNQDKKELKYLFCTAEKTSSSTETAGCFKWAEQTSRYPPESDQNQLSVFTLQLTACCSPASDPLSASASPWRPPAPWPAWRPAHTKQPGYRRFGPGQRYRRDKKPFRIIHQQS